MKLGNIFFFRLHKLLRNILSTTILKTARVQKVSLHIQVAGLCSTQKEKKTKKQFKQQKILKSVKILKLILFQMCKELDRPLFPLNMLLHKLHFIRQISRNFLAFMHCNILLQEPNSPI